MTLEVFIILLVRVAGALPVLRWPVAGAIIAIVVDLGDLYLRQALDLGGVPDYQALDKYADLAYLGTFFIMAMRWPSTPKRVAVGLLAIRMVGFIAFEATGERAILLFFPNVFEFWFLFAAIILTRKPSFRFTARNVALALAPLVALKEFQEYALHWGKWLDDVTAFDAARNVWEWLTAPFR